MATPLSVLKKPKMVLFPEKENGATDLKLGMRTQLDSVNNMERVPSGHTFSSLRVRLNMPIKVLLKKQNKTI